MADPATSSTLEIRNAACLATPLGTSAKRGRAQGEILRIRDAAIRDPHAGGIWTVRRCIRGKSPDASNEQVQYVYELRPDNDHYASMIVTVSKPQDLDVRAEFVSVVGT